MISAAPVTWETSPISAIIGPDITRRLDAGRVNWKLGGCWSSQKSLCRLRSGPSRASPDSRFPEVLPADIICAGLHVRNWLAPTAAKARGRRTASEFTREEQDETLCANGIDSRCRRRRAVGGLRRPGLYPGPRSQCGAQSVQDAGQLVAAPRGPPARWGHQGPG